MYERVLQADRLLTVDLVEQAEAIYREVADQDPLHAVAVVGLARCALARGDDRGAHELAARALAIDPEDDMARRMEARLAEVLAVRGDVVERPVAAASGGRPMRPVVAGTRVAASTSPRPDAADAPPADAAGAPEAPEPAPARRRLLDRLRGR